MTVEQMRRPKFSAVFRAHHDLVWRTLWRNGVERDAVDDATQDVFMVVHQKLEDFDERGSLRGWIIGIARNVARRYRERGMRVQRRPRLEVVAPVDPHVVLEQKEAFEHVDAFVEQLDAAQRDVFVLCDIEGIPATEVADTLGVKLNTVYSRLRLARRRFNQHVARYQARAARRDAWTG